VLLDGIDTTTTQLAQAVGTWSFANAAGGVSANLATGAVSIGGTAQQSIVTGANLVGSAFNDTLTGNAGNNTLTGGAGTDAYGFGRGGGQDVVVNGAGGNAGASGELDLAAGIATDQVWLVHTGNDLQVGVLGTTDRITVQGWYASPQAQLQKVVLADGSTLDTQVNSLVSAMATFQSNNSGFDPTAAANSHAPSDPTLQTALAVAWHH
jgi:hypothetical protein